MFACAVVHTEHMSCVVGVGGHSARIVEFECDHLCERHAYTCGHARSYIQRCCLRAGFRLLHREDINPSQGENLMPVCISFVDPRRDEVVGQVLMKSSLAAPVSVWRRPSSGVGRSLAFCLFGGRGNSEACY